MEFYKNGEVNKILEKYGAEKGEELLTCFFTHVIAHNYWVKYREMDERVLALFLSCHIYNIGGSKLYTEFRDFNEEYGQNHVLVTELYRTGSKYVDSQFDPTKEVSIAYTQTIK